MQQQSEGLHAAPHRPQPPRKALEWLSRMYDQLRGRSRRAVAVYFRGESRKQDLTTVIANLVSTAAKQAIPSGVLLHSPTAGSLQGTLDLQQAASFIYYRVCEHVLCSLYPAQDPAADQARRFKDSARVQVDTRAYDMVATEDFHMSIINAALEVVAAAALPDRPFPSMTQAIGRMNYTVSLWQGLRWVQECFNSSSELPLPEDLRQALQRTQLVVVEHLGYANGSSLYTMITKGGSCGLGEGDMSLLHAFTQYHSYVGISRVFDVAAALVGAGLLTGEGSRQYAARCAQVFDQLACQYKDMFFGQHLSVVVACVLYVTGKYYHLSGVSFKRIQEAVLKVLPWRDEVMWDTVELGSPTRATSPTGDTTFDAQQTDIRTWYNMRFLPRTEALIKHLLARPVPRLPPAAPPPAINSAHTSAAAAGSLLTPMGQPAPAATAGVLAPKGAGVMVSAEPPGGLPAAGAAGAADAAAPPPPMAAVMPQDMLQGPGAHDNSSSGGAKATSYTSSTAVATDTEEEEDEGEQDIQVSDQQAAIPKASFAAAAAAAVRAGRAAALTRYTRTQTVLLHSSNKENTSPLGVVLEDKPAVGPAAAGAATGAGAVPMPLRSPLQDLQASQSHTSYYPSGAAVNQPAMPAQLKPAAQKGLPLHHQQMVGQSQPLSPVLGLTSPLPAGTIISTVMMQQPEAAAHGLVLAPTLSGRQLPRGAGVARMR